MNRNFSKEYIPEVVGVGVPVSDYLINVDEMPKPNSGGWMRAHSWQFGGKVSSAMAALGRLGVSCTMMGLVGDDVNGKAQIQDFNFNGVNTDYMVVDADMDTLSCIVISDRQTNGRAILMCPSRHRQMDAQELDREVIAKARYLHLDNASQASVQAARWAREAGVKVVFDADGYNRDIEEMLGLIDVFIPSEFYYKKRYDCTDYESCCREIAELGPEIVVLTLGDKGCAGLKNGEFFTLPAFHVDVVDTTGAGDVFHGGFIYGLLQGWDAKECARWASAVSAIKCMGVGGRAALPTVDIVQRFLDTGEIDTGYIARRQAYYEKMPAERLNDC